MPLSDLQAIIFHYKSQVLYIIERDDSLQHTEAPLPEVPRWVDGHEIIAGYSTTIPQAIELRAIFDVASH